VTFKEVLELGAEEVDAGELGIEIESTVLTTGVVCAVGVGVRVVFTPNTISFNSL
jgi:hypothetical protein